MTQTTYSPTEPPVDTTNPPTSSTTESSIKGSEYISTSVCKNNLNELVDTFIKSFSNQDNKEIRDISILLKRKNIPIEKKIVAILKVLEVMKKQTNKDFEIEKQREQDHEGDLEEKKKQLETITQELKIIEEKITTKNKEYEYDENRYKLLVFETDLLKQLMIVTLFLFIFVILKQTGALSKLVVIPLYIICFGGSIMYFIYKYKQKTGEHDMSQFNDLEFNNPNEK